MLCFLKVYYFDKINMKHRYALITIFNKSFISDSWEFLILIFSGFWCSCISWRYWISNHCCASPSCLCVRRWIASTQLSFQSQRKIQHTGFCQVCHTNKINIPYCTSYWSFFYLGASNKTSSRDNLMCFDGTKPLKVFQLFIKHVNIVNEIVSLFNRLLAIWPNGYQCGSLGKSNQNDNCLKTSNAKKLSSCRNRKSAAFELPVHCSTSL